MKYVLLLFHIKRGKCYGGGLDLLFGENPQAVAYSAQPLYWSGLENSSPITHRGSVWKDGAEIP